MQMQHDSSAAMPLDRVLPYFRAAMPGVAGVVLATPQGHALAHDMPAPDARALAAQAIALHRVATGGAPLADATKGASIFVPSDVGVMLVVFMEAARAAGAGEDMVAVAA